MTPPGVAVVAGAFVAVFVVVVVVIVVVIAVVVAVVKQIRLKRKCQLEQNRSRRNCC